MLDLIPYAERLSCSSEELLRPSTGGDRSLTLLLTVLPQAFTSPWTATTEIKAYTERCVIAQPAWFSCIQAFTRSAKPLKCIKHHQAQRGQQQLHSRQSTQNDGSTCTTAARNFGKGEQLRIGHFRDRAQVACTDFERRPARAVAQLRPTHASLVKELRGLRKDRPMHCLQGFAVHELLAGSASGLRRLASPSQPAPE